MHTSCGGSHFILAKHSLLGKTSPLPGSETAPYLLPVPSRQECLTPRPAPLLVPPRYCASTVLRMLIPAPQWPFPVRPLGSPLHPQPLPLRRGFRRCQGEPSLIVASLMCIAPIRSLPNFLVRFLSYLPLCCAAAWWYFYFLLFTSLPASFPVVRAPAAPALLLGLQLASRLPRPFTHPGFYFGVSLVYFL